MKMWFRKETMRKQRTPSSNLYPSLTYSRSSTAFHGRRETDISRGRCKPSAQLEPNVLSTISYCQPRLQSNFWSETRSSSCGCARTCYLQAISAESRTIWPPNCNFDNRARRLKTLICSSSCHLNRLQARCRIP